MKTTNKKEFRFELYISDQNENGIIALANLNKFCHKYLNDNYEIVIIDLLRQPEAALEKKILVVPTIIKTKPKSTKRFIGDFSNFEKIKNELGIEVDEQVDTDQARIPIALMEQEEIRHAIEVGSVTPFVITPPDKDKHKQNLYKTIFESMYESAITLLDDGTIFYCNQSFATLVNEFHDKVIGTSIYKYLNKSQKKRLEHYINDSTQIKCRNEVLLTINHTEIPAYFSATKSHLNSVPIICIVVNDLSGFSKKKEIELNNLINDYDRMNNSLRISVNLAQQSDKAKRDFLANMSHELRTPLNSIIGYSEMIFNQIAGEVSAKQKQYLGEILQNSRYLLELINQLLDLTKIEANQIEFIPMPVDIHQLILEVSHGIKLSLKDKNIGLETYIDPKLGEIVLDPLKLKEVLYNFLTNAIKFTSKNGEIKVVVKKEANDFFRLEVIDSGIGIKEDDLKRLFVPFQKLTSITGEQFQGTGIGLSLTKLIIEAQGGKVGVNSVYGKGSTFYFVLPFKPMANSKFAVIG